MVWMDMEMPTSCSDCEFIAFFDEKRSGCILSAEDNGYGMELIRNPNKILKNCPLHPFDMEVTRLIESRCKELHVLRGDIDDQLEILEKYIVDE